MICPNGPHQPPSALKQLTLVFFCWKKTTNFYVNSDFDSKDWMVWKYRVLWKYKNKFPFQKLWGNLNYLNVKLWPKCIFLHKKTQYIFSFLWNLFSFKSQQYAFISKGMYCWRMTILCLTAISPDCSIWFMNRSGLNKVSTTCDGCELRCLQIILLKQFCASKCNQALHWFTLPCPKLQIWWICSC